MTTVQTQQQAQQQAHAPNQTPNAPQTAQQAPSRAQAPPEPVQPVALHTAQQAHAQTQTRQHSSVDLTAISPDVPPFAERDRQFLEFIKGTVFERQLYHRLWELSNGWDQLHAERTNEASPEQVESSKEDILHTVSAIASIMAEAYQRSC